MVVILMPSLELFTRCGYGGYFNAQPRAALPGVDMVVILMPSLELLYQVGYAVVSMSSLCLYFSYCVVHDPLDACYVDES